MTFEIKSQETIDKLFEKLKGSGVTISGDMTKGTITHSLPHVVLEYINDSISKSILKVNIKEKSKFITENAIYGTILAHIVDIQGPTTNYL